MKWYQVKAVCAQKNIENVTAAMSMTEPSVSVEDYSDILTDLRTVYGDLLDEKLLTADKTVASCSIYMPDAESAGKAVEEISERLAAAEIRADTSIIELDDGDWKDAWKKFYKTRKIGKRLVIVPDWEEYGEKPGELVIRMEPGLAFGTGTHETTRLCAGLAEDYLKPGDYMLDIGTGSGILAICASKLGAGYCAACDIDETAVRTAEENVKKNGAANVNCFVSDLLSDVKLPGGRAFDFVTANIVADIIIRLSPELPHYMKNGGLAAVSGIIDSREAEVDAAMIKQGFSKLEARHENGWCAALFVKK